MPNVLKSLVEDATLIFIDGEYRLQTPESIDWDADYRNRRSRILGDEVRMASERETAFRIALATALKDLAFVQGVSKTPRKYEMHFGSEMPPIDGSSVPVWIQNGWSVSEGSVREEARRSGVDNPTVFVFLPRLEADELKQTVGRFRAAEETVNTRAVPLTSAGIEAREAMRSRITLEKNRVSSLVDNVIKHARIYQGGGNEITGEPFPEAIRQAVEAALARLFPKFSDADQPAWSRVVTRAAEGNADPLSALSYTSDVEKHPVCQEVRNYVGGSGRKGSDVRRHFSDPPYGWSRDTVDGALLALLAGGPLRAARGGETVAAKGMTQQQVGVTEFFTEGVIVNVVQRIEVRKIASAMGLSTKSGEEAEAVPVILECLESAAKAASGEAPLPEPPDTTLVRQLHGMTGNRQIVEVADQAVTIITNYQDWSVAGEAARERLPEWRRLERFLHHARNLPVATDLNPQLEAICSQRTLLTDPNPIPPLLNQVTAALRKAVSEAHRLLRKERDRAVGELEASTVWLQLEAEDRARILESNGLWPITDLDIGADQALMDRLEETALEDWEDRLLALRTRTDRAREEAARLLMPKAVTVRPTPATLNSREDVEAYIRQLRDHLLAQIDERPVIIP